MIGILDIYGNMCKVPLTISHPELCKEWHHTKNEKGPECYSCGSGYKAWWKCLVNNEHEWKSNIYNRVNSECGCPYCINKFVCNDNNLLIKFPEIAKEWHPTKNGNKNPEDFVFGSHYKAWWQCSEKEAHIWETTICNRTNKNKTGCPYCSNNRVCDDNNFLILFPQIAIEWHPTKNENNKPDNFTYGSHYKAWWQCSKNKKHEWKTEISCRTGAAKSSCPYCADKKVCDDNNLLAMFPLLAKEWHPTKNGNKKPENFMPGSDIKIWWICFKNKKHEWKTAINDRAGIAKSGCPYCSTTVSKPETKWLNTLNIPIEDRNIYIKLPNGKKYKPDAYIKETNTIYEFNGDYWHGNPKRFNPNDINKQNHKTFGELYKNTLQKEAELKSYGYNVITMWESDFVD